MINGRSSGAHGCKCSSSHSCKFGMSAPPTQHVGARPEHKTNRRCEFARRVQAPASFAARKNPAIDRCPAQGRDQSTVRQNRSGHRCEMRRHAVGIGRPQPGRRTKTAHMRGSIDGLCEDRKGQAEGRLLESLRGPTWIEVREDHRFDSASLQQETTEPDPIPGRQLREPTAAYAAFFPVERAGTETTSHHDLREFTKADMGRRYRFSCGGVILDQGRDFTAR